MNQRTTSRCTQVVAPTLAEGEQVQMVEAVQIGKVSAKQQIAASAIVGVATAGTVVVALKPRPFYLVVTNQRLIFLNNLRGRVGTIAAAAPLTAVTAEPLRPHLLTLSMNVTINSTPQRFSWGRAQASMARRVADALTQASTAPAA